MREIKFQFIIDNNKVSRPYTLEEILNTTDEVDILEDLEDCNCSLNESNNHCEGDCVKYANSVITGKRQYIGVKDKNGKEIYDGDIVSKQGAYILWNDDLACWCFNFKLSTTLSTPLFHNHLPLEVIGNIYENSELLKPN